MEIKFSVIIPFYNARDYIYQAVESALQLPATGELLIIEDNSPDGGLDICRELAKKYTKVKLLRHFDGVNRGASASRNLGIIKAKYDYVSFLDADDFYLPNRFENTIDVITSNSNVDGVYEAIGLTVESNISRNIIKEINLIKLRTINREFNPDTLFDKLMNLNANFGSMHLNGLTVKKELFIKTGLFNEQLRFHQDSEIIWKLFALGRFFPGNIYTPVAMWRAHENNRITYHQADKRKYYKTSLDMWRFLSDWGMKNLSLRRQILIALRYIAKIRNSDKFIDSSARDFMDSRGKMFQILSQYPRLIFIIRFWRLVLPSKFVFIRK